MRSVRTSGAIAKAIAVVSAVGTAVTVLLGAHEVLAGRLTPGELLIFVAYVGSLYKPVRDLGRLVGQVLARRRQRQRVAEILDTEPDAEDAPDAMELTARRPARSCSRTCASPMPSGRTGARPSLAAHRRRRTRGAGGRLGRGQVAR
jgi:ABC-type multidrug transport system fused ATPase/permease subunit